MIIVGCRLKLIIGMVIVSIVMGGKVCLMVVIVFISGWNFVFYGWVIVILVLVLMIIVNKFEIFIS